MLKPLMVLCITLPWLNPFAPGPSPAVMPWLVALAASACLILVAHLRQRTGKNASNTFSSAECWGYTAACAWVIAGVISSGIGLLQYFGASVALDPWVNQTRFGEAFANLRQRNQFASLTNIALAALIWWAATASVHLNANGRANGRSQWLIMLVAGLLAIGNAASSSRTGLVQLFGLCALFGVWGLWRRPVVHRVVLVVVVVYSLAALALPWLAGLDLSVHGIAARLRGDSHACASRITLWSNVLHLIAKKPLLGWGWGELDYAHYITLYDGPRFCEILDNAHNLPLQLAVELGMPLALLVCGGFVWWVLRQRPWAEADPNRQLAWSVLAVILVHSMLEYPLWYGPFQMAFALCLRMLWQPLKVKVDTLNDAKTVSNSLVTRHIKIWSALVLIAGVAYAASDYHRVSQIYLSPESRDASYRIDTLSKIQDSRLFGEQAHFAGLILTPLTSANAEWTYDSATSLLHYSPEPRVIEKVIESAVLLGRDDEALAHLARYRAAFEEDHARWVKANTRKSWHGLR